MRASCSSALPSCRHPLLCDLLSTAAHVGSCSRDQCRLRAGTRQRGTASHHVPRHACREATPRQPACQLVFGEKCLPVGVRVHASIACGDVGRPSISQHNSEDCASCSRRWRLPILMQPLDSDVALAALIKACKDPWRPRAVIEGLVSGLVTSRGVAVDSLTTGALLDAPLIATVAWLPALRETASREMKWLNKWSSARIEMQSAGAPRGRRQARCRLQQRRYDHSFLQAEQTASRTDCDGRGGGGGDRLPAVDWSVLTNRNAWPGSMLAATAMASCSCLVCACKSSSRSHPDATRESVYFSIPILAKKRRTSRELASYESMESPAGSAGGIIYLCRLACAKRQLQFIYLLCDEARVAALVFHSQERFRSQQ